MLLEREVKGYATIKFAISCCLFYLAFTSIYTFLSLWDEENVKLQKFTYFLLIIVSVAAILFLNAHIALKRFVMGVRRYNQIRQLDQSKYANDVQIRAPLLMVTKSNIKRKNEQSHKIKKHHSIQPADLLDRQARKNQQQQKHRKYTKSYSLQTPNSNSQSYHSYNSQSQKSRNQQLTALFSQYKMGIQQKNSTLQREKKRIEKCKNIIGRIFQAQTNQQIDNIQDLINHIEMLFDVKVVEHKTQRGGKARIVADVGRLYEEVLLDEVLGWKQKGGIWFGGYRFNSRAQQQPQYKTQKLNQIDRIIAQLYEQDRLLNFNTIFPTHKSRLSTIEQLKRITRHYLQNRPLLTSDNPNEQYEIKQLIIWILSAHINKQIYNKLNQIKIFLEDSTCQFGRIVYVRWRDRQVQGDCLAHFNQVYERVRAEERVQRGGAQVEVYREVFACAPGDDNIASLLSMYLGFVGRQFKSQLPAVKQIESYVNQVMII